MTTKGVIFGLLALMLGGFMLYDVIKHPEKSNPDPNARDFKRYALAFFSIIAGVLLIIGRI
jgi:hypothetical protein